MQTPGVHTHDTHNTPRRFRMSDDGRPTPLPLPTDTSAPTHTPTCTQARRIDGRGRQTTSQASQPQGGPSDRDAPPPHRPRSTTPTLQPPTPPGGPYDASPRPNTSSTKHHVGGRLPLPGTVQGDTRDGRHLPPPRPGACARVRVRKPFFLPSYMRAHPTMRGGRQTPPTPTPTTTMTTPTDMVPPLEQPRRRGRRRLLLHARGGPSRGGCFVSRVCMCVGECFWCGWEANPLDHLVCPSMIYMYDPVAMCTCRYYVLTAVLCPTFTHIYTHLNLTPPSPISHAVHTHIYNKSGGAC